MIPLKAIEFTRNRLSPMLHLSTRNPMANCLMIGVCLIWTTNLFGQEQPPLLAQPAAQETSASEDKKTAWVDFNKDIAPIFREHCLQCHQGPQPKGGLDINDRQALLGYIAPGSLADSSLWNDYLTAKPISEDAESLVMPPDGPLPRAKLALLKLWIEEGADWPQADRIDQSDDRVEKAVLGANASLPRRLYLAIGYFHPAVVHFPIALLSIAGLSIALSWVFGQGCVRFAYGCLVLGAFGSLAAALMGWSFAEIRGLSGWTEMITSTADERQSNEFFHRWLGTLTALASLVVAWMAYRSGKPDGTRPGKGWKAATLVLALLVALVGHQGGEMVYGDIFAQAIEQFNRR
jgi:uncharacterized membrane protein